MTKTGNERNKTRRRKHTHPQRNAWKLRSPGIRRVRNTRHVRFPNIPTTRVHTVNRYLKDEGLVITSPEFARTLSDRNQIQRLLQHAGINNKRISNSNMTNGSFKLLALNEFGPRVTEAELLVNQIKQRYQDVLIHITNERMKNELFMTLQRAIAYFNRAKQGVQLFLKASMKEEVYSPIKDEIIDDADNSIVESMIFLEILGNKNSKAKITFGNNNGNMNEL